TTSNATSPRLMPDDIEPASPALCLDEQRLAQWLSAHVENFAGPLRVTRFKGGQSNPTYRLDTPQRSYLLRRKPPGDLLKGAHAIDREHRVMAALHEAGFPVPRMHELCMDRDVIGTEFYLMDFVRGRVFWDPRLPEVDPSQRAACFDAMNETIARLHAFDT